MFRDDYHKELDNITADDNFKAETIQLMLQKQQNAPQHTDNSIKFTQKYKKQLKTAACMAIMSLSLIAFSAVKSNFLIGADSAANETAGVDMYDSAAVEQDNDSVNNRYVPAGTDKKYWLTIDDCRPLASPTQKLERTDMKTVTYSFFNQGMGYEAHMVYGPSQLEFNPEYNLEDEFDTLPVYRFTPLTAQQAMEETEKVISAMNSTVSDISYTWSRPVYYEDGQLMTNEHIVTYTADSPGKEFSLNYIDVNITTESGATGTVSLWTGRGNLRIIVDEAVSLSDKPAEIYAGAEEKYPELFSMENKSYRTWFDYSYFAEKNYNQFVYQKTDDYGQNIFNATLNNISIFVGNESEEKPVPDETIMWVSMPYYTREADLPAINYRQALTLLYSGQFYSSKTDTISEDDVVQHTELVYMTPEYNMEIPGYEGYSLPFYKFYIQSPDVERETLGGILKEYYVCYVCAINPALVDINGDYGADKNIQFNGAPVK